MSYCPNLQRLLTTIGLIGSLCLLSACGGSAGGDPPKNNTPSSSASASSESSEASEASSSQASQVAAKPNSPTSLDVSAIGFDQVTLKWQAPANLTNVAIYRILRDGVVIGTTESTDTSYTDTDLTPISQYTYRVQSGDGNGNWSLLSGGLSVRTAPTTSPISSSSSSSSSKTSSSSSRRSSSSRSSASSSAPQTDFSAPTTPTNLQPTGVNHNRIDIAWEASTDNVEVTLYRIIRNGEQVATVSGQGQTYLDLELDADTEYDYQVQAGDDAGNWSELTPIIMVRTVFPPISNGTSLEWTHPTRRQNGNALTLGEIGGYEIRYRRNSLENFQTAIVDGNWTTTYPLGGIPSDYDFQIAVYDTEGLYSAFIQIYAK